MRNWPYLLRTSISPLLAMVLNHTYHATMRFRPLPFTQAEQQQWHYTSSHDINRWERDDAWRVIDGEFTNLMVVNTKYPASDILIAPSAECDDGGMYASVLRGKYSFFRKLWLFLKFEDGSHNAEPDVELFKIDEFVLHPHTPAGNMCLSGESVPVNSIHIKMQHKAACFVF